MKPENSDLLFLHQEKRRNRPEKLDDEFQNILEEPQLEKVEKKLSTPDLEFLQHQTESNLLFKDIKEPLILQKLLNLEEVEANKKEFTLEQAKPTEPSELISEGLEEKKSEKELPSPKQQADSDLFSEDIAEPLILPAEPDPKVKTEEQGDYKSKPDKKEFKNVNKPDQKKLFTSSISMIPLFQNSRLLGLDIGTSSLKYIILKKTVRGLDLIDCGIRPIPADSVNINEEERKVLFSKVLREKLNKKIFKNTLVTSTVSGLEVLFHNIQLPKMNPKQLQQAVTWACRKDIPFPIESAVIEYQVFDRKDKKTDGKLDILVVAVQEHLVSNHLEILQKAQIRPTKISTMPVALWNLFRMVVKKDTDKCYAIIDIGSKYSHIVFINRGQLQFAREITTASDDFSESLTGAIFFEGKEFHLNRKRAEQIKKKYGIPDENSRDHTDEGIPLKEISVMMRPVLERLMNEIQRTIDFYKEKCKVEGVEKIFLTGGGALLKNLTPNLSRGLNIEVEILNPFQIISTKNITNQQELERIAPRFGVAVGLALDRKKELNFLPQHLKRAQTLKTIKKISGFSLFFLTLIMVVFSHNVSLQAQKIEKEFKRIREEYKKAEPKRNYFLSLQKKLGDLKAKNHLYNKDLKVSLTASKYLKALSHLIPRNITLTALRIERRNIKSSEKKDTFITQEVVILQGVTFEKNNKGGINLAKFLLELEKSNYFLDIILKRQKIREDGNLEFILECHT